MSRADAISLLDRANKLVHNESGIMGKVYDDNGKPLAGANITIRSTNTNIVMQTTLSDESGTYEVKLEPGSYSIILTKGTLVAYNEKIEVKNNIKSISLEAAKRGQKVIGKIVDVNNKALADTEILIKSVVTFSVKTNQLGLFEVFLPLGHAFSIQYLDGTKETGIRNFTTSDSFSDVLDLDILHTVKKEPVSPSTSLPGNNASTSPEDPSTNQNPKETLLTLVDDNGELEFKISNVVSGFSYSMITKREGEVSEASLTGNTITLPKPNL